VALLVVSAGNFKRDTITDVQLPLLNCLLHVSVILLFHYTPTNYFPINMELSIKIGARGGAVF
jgi:hypothetical protein